ncbi:MAG TPA: M23 family metallopeptidase [Thermoanaerobaculales bacterium]|nr:M23 family metallopeptidase [Thermoanaerobaculales bacterium]HQL30922.1 M23 family metallopeptidase [Thermoanaerobaculales bacterium]
MYEIQLHPADIRKQVRYYFLSRRAYHWLVGALAGLALIVLGGVVLSPLSLRTLLLTSELRALRQQNELQREILEQRTAALARTERALEADRAREQQMRLILGMPEHPADPAAVAGERALAVTVPDAARAYRRGLELDAASQALLTQAGEIASFARARADLAAGVPSICPVPVGSFVLTSPFGDRISPFTNATDFHAGIDLAAREGTPVLATGGGRVVFAGRFPLRRHVRWWRYGNVVVLSHTGGYLTVYAHLQNIDVRQSQQLQRGQRLGAVGSTGWSTSPHLHYEVRAARAGYDEAVPVDPRIYILNYQWKGHEALLARSRSAPATTFDPLPSLVNVR